MSHPAPAPTSATIAPVSRVGVIGGGQLAGMMAAVAPKLPVDLWVQTPAATDPAVELATGWVPGAIADAQATAQLAAQCDVVTFENEFVDLAALQPLANAGVCFRPSLAVLAPLLDKYDQRCFLQQLGLPVPSFVTLPDDATDLPAPFQFPVVLKTRRHGYDGQGTVIVRDAATWQTVRTKLRDRPLLLEAFVPFKRELAVIAARGLDGTVVCYPPVATHQVDQVCRWVIAPAPVSETVVAQVTAIAQTLLTELDAIGVFGIEFFLTDDDKVLVNEIAPRTHNSGHFSLDACATSQFEQHLRAVCGLPLGHPELRSAAAVMVNLLGYEHATQDYAAQRQQLAAMPQAHVHWYGKTEARPGRKLGHVTVLLDQPLTSNAAQAQQVAQRIEALWYGSEAF